MSRALAQCVHCGGWVPKKKARPDPLDHSETFVCGEACAVERAFARRRAAAHGDVMAMACELGIIRLDLDSQ